MVFSKQPGTTRLYTHRITCIALCITMPACATSMSITSLLALLLSLFVHPSIVSAASLCDADPCFQSARVPAVCCPTSAIITANSSTTVQDQAARLGALVNTVCSDSCVTPVFQDYRECLTSANNNAARAALAVLNERLCNLRCVTRAGARFEDLANCSTVLTLSEECLENIQSLPPALGQGLSSIVQRCSPNSTIEGPSQDVLPSAPAPSSFSTASAPASNGAMSVMGSKLVVLLATVIVCVLTMLAM